MAVGKSRIAQVDYPESDGKPLAETELHLQQIFDLYAALRLRFRDRPEVHVNADLLLYFVEGKPKKCVAPDVMVTFGIAPGLRRVFKLWEEKVPSVVIEVTSKKTRSEDTGPKLAKYAQIGVPELYLIDPTGDYLVPQLRAYRLHNGVYVDVVGSPLISPALQLELRVIDDPQAAKPPGRRSRRLLQPACRLRLADPKTGELLPIPDELVEEARLAHAAAERAVRAAEKRADAAEVRAAQAERELQRLRKELARLRGEDE